MRVRERKSDVSYTESGHHPMQTSLVLLLSSLLVLAGLAGTVLPLLPGIALVFAGPGFSRIHMAQ